MDELLKQLSELYAQRDLLNADMATKRQEILAPVQAQLDALEEVTAPMFEAINQKIAALENEAKEAVIQEGKSVKGFGLHLVYTAGRVTWDAKFLDGLAAAHPDIIKARKVGQPSVSIRRDA